MATYSKCAETVFGARPDDGMTLRLERPCEETTVVEVAGEIDARSAPRLWRVLRDRLDSEDGTLVVELTGVRFAGVAAMRVLLQAWVLAGESDVRLVVEPGTSRAARRMLDLLSPELPERLTRR
jgi:anti-anti-sigma factor